MQRAQNISVFLEDIQNIRNIHLATSCRQEISSLSITQTHILKYGIGDIDYETYATETFLELNAIIDENDIDILFHDTYFVTNVILKRRDIWHFFIFRLTSKEHYLSIKKYFPYFKKVFFPHSYKEFISIIGEEEAQEFQDIFVFTGYIFPLEVLKEEERKHSILVSPGLGWDLSQTKTFLSYVWDLILSLENPLDVILYPGKYREELEKELDFSFAKKVCDFSIEYKKDFSQADIFIGRWGYNSVWECILYSKKALLFWAERKDESQNERIDFFSKRYNFLKTGTWDKKRDEDTLRSLYDSTDKQENFPENGGNIIKATLIEIFSRPSIFIFYPSYFQKSHIFIWDELNELSKSVNISIYTFNSFFWESLFAHNNYRVFYNSFFDSLYQKDVYPFIHRFPKNLKKLYAVWIIYMRQQIEKYTYTTGVTEFLSDGVYINSLRNIAPDIKFLTFCRGKDIYHTFQSFPFSLQETTFQSHQKFFVMDTSMKEKLLQFWCLDNKVELFYVGKNIGNYTFKPIFSFPISIVIWGRFVPKKGILETLDFIEEVLERWNVNIWKIYLLGEIEFQYSDYWVKILERVRNSYQLSQKIVQCGFLPQNAYRKIITKEAHVFIGHFTKGDDGDEDGIPNVILENMLVWNLIFSTLSWGISDIIFDKKTWYIFSWKQKEDIEKFEQVIIDVPLNERILNNARDFVCENFDIVKQAWIIFREIQ